MSRCRTLPELLLPMAPFHHLGTMLVPYRQWGCCWCTFHGVRSILLEYRNSHLQHCFVSSKMLQESFFHNMSLRLVSSINEEFIRRLRSTQQHCGRPGTSVKRKLMGCLMVAVYRACNAMKIHGNRKVAPPCTMLSGTPSDLLWAGHLHIHGKG